MIKEEVDRDAILFNPTLIGVCDEW